MIPTRAAFQNYKMVTRYDEPIRVYDELTAQDVWATRSEFGEQNDSYIYDMSENIAGIPQITIPEGYVDEGSEVVIRMAEILYPQATEEVSPLYQVTENAPPTYLQHGMADTAVDYMDSVNLYNRLMEVTGDSRNKLELFPCFTHAINKFISQENAEKIVAWLDNVLEDLPEMTGELSIKPGQNSVTISWENAENALANQKYVVYCDGEKVGETQSLTYTLEGLEAGREYEFSIRAMRLSGEESDWLSVTLTLPGTEEAVLSATAPESAQVNDEFVVKIVTNNAVSDVRLLNENGMAMGRKQVEIVENDDGTKTFYLTISVGTVGNDRAFTVITQDNEGVFSDSGVTVSLDITSVQPVIISFDVPESVSVDETFTVQAVTDLDATKIEIYNEYGLKMGLKSLTSKIVDGQKVWMGEMSIGTKGERTFLAYAVNKYGARSEALTDNISVKEIA